MMDSDSEEEHFVPALLSRPKVANHIVDECFTVDTRDHEDHTFCGVMFDVCCRGLEDGGTPLEFLQIDALSVRGDLGPMTVWTTPMTFKRKEHLVDSWKCVYEREHGPSRDNYEKLQLTEPIRLGPGETCGIYVHSKLPGDDGIVYDNQRSRVTYEDQSFRVLPGLAHLSNRPFGRNGMWGFPWRENREFVGQVSYGIGYVLWNPVQEVHRRFPLEFRQAVLTLLLCGRRVESPLHCVQDEVIFYIANMCKHDWFCTRTVVDEQPEPRTQPQSVRPGLFHGRFNPWDEAYRPVRPLFRALPSDSPSEDSDEEEEVTRPQRLQESSEDASEESDEKQSDVDISMGDADDFQVSAAGQAECKQQEDESSTGACDERRPPKIAWGPPDEQRGTGEARSSSA